MIALSAPKSVLKFDPTTISGLFGWYDADDASSFTFGSGVQVSQWNDKSGSGNHLKQTTGASQPTYSATGGPNSRGSVTFGSSTFLIADAYGSAKAQPVTMVIVCNLPSTSQWVVDGATAAPNRLTWGMGPSLMGAYAGSVKYSNVGFGTETDVGIWTIVFNGTSTKIYRNGIDAELQTGGIGSGSLARFQLAKEQSGALYFTGKVCEIIQYSAALTDAQIDYVNAGLSQKYALPVHRRESTFTTVSSASCVYTEPKKRAHNGCLILYCHGSGETSTAVTTDPLKRELFASLSDMGFLIAASDAGGNNWGTLAACAQYEALHAAMLVAFPSITKTVIIGQSMGGLASLTMIKRGLIPCDAWIGIYPVCSLSNMWNGGSGSFATAIKTAYGIAADGSDYASKTSGCDPLLNSGSDYTDMPMRFYASSGDVTVSKSANTDAMASLVTGYASEQTVISCTGTHGDPSHFLPGDVQEYLYRILAL